jgi:hypothetical protein
LSVSEVDSDALSVAVTVKLAIPSSGSVISVVVTDHVTVVPPGGGDGGASSIVIVALLVPMPAPETLTISTTNVSPGSVAKS